MKNVHFVIGDLQQTLKNLRFFALYRALEIPPHKIWKRYKARQYLKATVVWLWSECLATFHPEHAKTTYYYAQAWNDTKKIRKYFFYRKYHAKCGFASIQNGPPDLARLARTLIDKIGIKYRSEDCEKPDDTQKKVVKFLSEIQDYFVGSIMDADLAHTETMFRDRAAADLGLIEINTQQKIVYH